MYISVVFLLLFSVCDISHAAENEFFIIETEGQYKIEPKASIDQVKKYALFRAQRVAVDIGGKYFVRKFLIPDYGRKMDEIHCLSVRNMEYQVIDQEKLSIGNMKIFQIRIKAKIQPSDFVKAEMESIDIENKEKHQSYKEEMEQHILSETDIGKDIAKAYRLLRKKRWRIALIYLDHLENKYPNWESIYMTKAIVYYVMHEPGFMKNALQEACRLGNQIACDDVKKLKKVNKYNFGLSISE
jgi:hypothetical protein